MKKSSIDLNKRGHITAIWLRRSGHDVYVLVEIDKKWYKVISEFFDGYYSHIAEIKNWDDEKFEKCLEDGS